MPTRVVTTPAKKKPAAMPAPAAKKRAVSKPAAKPAAPVEKPNGEAKAKPAKTKLVRDSFTMPDGEYAVIAQLKQRALHLARPARKSELLRAGVKALAAMGDPQLLDALSAVPTIKTGRPKSKKAGKGDVVKP